MFNFRVYTCSLTHTWSLLISLIFFQDWTLKKCCATRLLSMVAKINNFKLNNSWKLTKGCKLGTGTRENRWLGTHLLLGECLWRGIPYVTSSSYPEVWRHKGPTPAFCLFWGLLLSTRVLPTKCSGKLGHSIVLDLFHYLLSCSYFNSLRRKFKLKSVVNTLSFRNVMNNENTLFNVATFVKGIVMSLKEII